eukprot:gene1309-1326_t
MSIVADDIDARIGARIRDLRQSLGLTLDGLAARSVVSRAMLSRIEHGQSSPTAQLLNKICGGLGVTLSMLFAETAVDRSPVSRWAEQPVWRDPQTGYVRRNVSPAGTGSSTEITEIAFPAGESVVFRNEDLPGSDQHVWVLEGVLEMGVGEEVFVLARGDCLRMRFGQAIRFSNPTRGTVRYAVIPDADGGWGLWCWRRARKKAWSAPPEIALRRLARAEELGMTYKDYTLEILERGKFSGRLRHRRLVSMAGRACRHMYSPGRDAASARYAEANDVRMVEGDRLDRRAVVQRGVLMEAVHSRMKDAVGPGGLDEDLLGGARAVLERS